MPPTGEAVPLLQRLVVGAEVKVAPLLDPHTPATIRFAEQLAFEPPFTPVQFHDHGPVPLTAVAVPELHRFVVGAEVKSPPLLLPHTPVTIRFAEQLAFEPPLVPLQVQLQGPVPETVEAVPLPQRLEVGAEVKSPPLLLPQEAFTMRFAEQFAVEPPFDPEQLQLQGPEPETVEAVPLPQRLEVGAEVKFWPLLLPHTPLTIGGSAVQFAVAPP